MAPSPKAPLHDPEHAPSWYAATAHPQPGLSALAGDVRCDAVVIGGGLTGVTAALELAERGFDTVLLEARRIGWGASGRNSGQIGTGYSPPMALLARLAGEAGARDLWAMAEEAKALLYGRIARHGIDCDLVPGQLIAAVKRRHLAELADTLAEWQAYGYEEARLLDRDETLARVACPAYLGGLHDPGAGHLHTLNYVLGLAEAARAAGARLFEGSEELRLGPGGGGTAGRRGEPRHADEEIRGDSGEREGEEDGADREDGDPEHLEDHEERPGDPQLLDDDEPQEGGERHQDERQ